MKNMLREFIRLIIERSPKLILGVFVAVSFILVEEVQADVILAEEFTWPYQSVAASSCQTFKHTLAGPGILTIRTKMKPFRSRDFATSSEDILTHSLGYFAESLGQTINGIKGANSNDFAGKAVDRISQWKIDNKQYNTEFKICNPLKCNFAGDCAQYQAAATIIIDYTPANSTATTASTPSSSATTPGGSQASVIGVWVRTADGRVIDRMEIAKLGDGYKVELREGDDAPLYASGFGILQGNRLVVATRNAANGVSGLVVLTFTGERVHYRSYYLDGRQAWDGEFLRRK